MAARSELGLLNNPEVFLANDPGDEWAFSVAEILGNPKDSSQRHSKHGDIYQTVSYLLNDNKGNPLRLTIAKWIAPGRSAFHSNLTRLSDNLCVDVPAAHKLRIDPKAGSLQFIGNGPADPEFQFTFFKTGKWIVLN